MCSACSEVETELEERICVCGHREGEHHLVHYGERVNGKRPVANICFHDDAPELTIAGTVCPCMEFKDCLALRTCAAGKS